MAELLKHINTVVKASGKKSLFAMIFSMEGLKMMADGNIGCVISLWSARCLVGHDTDHILFVGSTGTSSSSRALPQARSWARTTWVSN